MPKEGMGALHPFPIPCPAYPSIWQKSAIHPPLGLILSAQQALTSPPTDKDNVLFFRVGEQCPPAKENEAFL